MASTQMQAQNRRGAVTDVQRYLRCLSYRTEGMPRVPVDGIFDTQTEEAVLFFQRLSGLPATGEVDYETWTRLQDAYGEAEKASREPERVPLFPLYPEGYVLNPESGHYRILLLQFLLNEVRTIYDTMPELSPDGTYGEDTALAVLRFQQAEGLPEEDYVSAFTWNALVRAYSRLCYDRQP